MKITRLLEQQEIDPWNVARLLAQLVHGDPLACSGQKCSGLGCFVFQPSRSGRWVQVRNADATKLSLLNTGKCPPFIGSASKSDAARPRRDPEYTCYRACVTEQ